MVFANKRDTVDFHYFNLSINSILTDGPGQRTYISMGQTFRYFEPEIGNYKIIHTWQVSTHMPDPNGDPNGGSVCLGVTKGHQACLSPAKNTDFLPAFSRFKSNREV